MRFTTKTLLILIILLPVFVSGAQEADSGYTVAEVIDLQQLAGPASTATYLSPDGSRYVHFNDNSLCVYTLPENEEETCLDLDDELRPNLETGRWSPDGQYFAFVDNSALVFLEDADVQMLDIATGELRNVTDDSYADNFYFNIDEEAVFSVDIALAWSDDSQLAVLSYPYENGINADNAVQVIVIDPATGESDVQIERALDFPYLYYTLAWSGNTIATGEAPVQLDAGIQSIDLYDAETGDLREEFPLSSETPIIFSLQFSADNDYILAYNPIPRNENRRFDPDYDGIVYADLAQDSEHNLDNEQFVIQAGFAPEGNAVAYVVQNPFNPESAGLYIAPAIGEPGELVLEIEQADATTPLAQIPLTWASNNTIMIRDNETWNAILVVLEQD